MTSWRKPDLGDYYIVLPPSPCREIITYSPRTHDMLKETRSGRLLHSSSPFTMLGNYYIFPQDTWQVEGNHCTSYIYHISSPLTSLNWISALQVIMLKPVKKASHGNYSGWWQDMVAFDTVVWFLKCQWHWWDSIDFSEALSVIVDANMQATNTWYIKLLHLIQLLVISAYLL